MKNLEMREAVLCDLEALQHILENDAGYSMRVSGNLPKNRAAEEMMAALPSGCATRDKFVFLFSYRGEVIGCADVIRGYPNKNIAWIGLLLFDERHQRLGFGHMAFAKIETQILQSPEINKIRLSVVMANSMILPFWFGLGFTQAGPPKPYRSGTINSELIILEKMLNARTMVIKDKLKL